MLGSPSSFWLSNVCICWNTLGKNDYSFESQYNIEKKFKIFDHDKFDAVILPHFYIYI